MRRNKDTRHRNSKTTHLPKLMNNARIHIYLDTMPWEALHVQSLYSGELWIRNNGLARVLKQAEKPFSQESKYKKPGRWEEVAARFIRIARAGGGALANHIQGTTGRR